MVEPRGVGSQHLAYGRLFQSVVAAVVQIDRPHRLLEFAELALDSRLVLSPTRVAGIIIVVFSTCSRSARSS